MTRIALIVTLVLTALPAAARQPGHTTSWTNHNDSDPGIALVTSGRPRPRR